ncbi:salivary glue protein Sgs-3-like [Pocillopora verrucosa]|uniref:salivary glue protein Sgs-3-like n=1 Tax=Pocillopora verrucosa TaxID=203993 RepID=UPI0033428991
MRLQLNAVIFITLSLGKLPFISSSKNTTQTQNVTLAELERVILKFFQTQPDARRRLGNKTLLQVAALPKENQENDDSAFLSTPIMNSISTEPLQKTTNKTATSMSKSTNAKPRKKPATKKSTTAKSATAKSTSIRSTTAKSTTAKSTTAIPTTSRPTTKTEVTTIAATTETIPKQTTTIPTTVEATIAKPLKLMTTKETTAIKASTTKPSTTKSKTKQKTAKETTEKATNAKITPKPVITKAKNTTESTTNTTQTGKSNSTNHSPSVNPGSGLSQLIKHRVSFPVLFMVMLVFIVAVYFGYHNRNKINHFLKEGFVKAKKGGSGYLKVKVEDGDYIELPRDANRQYVY